MRIENIYIESFGAHKNRSFEFGKGINLIEGENESGKSTISAFIKFIFFGLDSVNDRGSVSEKRKYVSWDTDSACGRLDFFADGKRYRIERSLTPADDKGRRTEKIRITDLDNNEVCLDGKDPGMYFFGVSGEAFTQTAYIRQTESSSISGSAVVQAIENMLFSGDEKTSPEKACADLDALRYSLLYRNKKGGLMYEFSSEKARVEKRLVEAREQNARLIALDSMIRETSEQIEESGKEADDVRSILRACEAKRDLEKFALLDQCKIDYDSASDALAKFREENSVDGFLPDRAYLDSIISLDSEVRKAKEDLAAARNEKKALGGDRIDNDDLKLIEKYESEGREETLREFFDNYRRKSRLSKILGIFFSIFAALWIALGAVILLVGNLSQMDIFGIRMFFVGVGAAGIGLLMIILAIVFFVSSASSIRKNDRKIESFGVTSEEEIYELSNAALSRAEDQRVYVEKLIELEQKCRAAELAAVQKEERLKAEAGRWKTIAQESENASVLIEEIGGVLHRLEILEGEEAHAKDKYESMVAITGDLDRDSASADLTAVDLSGFTDDDEKAKREEYKEICDRIEVLKNRLDQYRIESASLEGAVSDTAEILDDLAAVTLKYNETYKLYAAAESAGDSLRSAAFDLRNEVSPRLSLQAGEYMSSVTAGRYSGLSVSPELGIKFGSSDGSSFSARESDYMSEGTKDVAYLSLRLALIGYLYRKELPPLVFDEAFSRLDDTRLAAMFKLIDVYTGENSQAFIFTSQTRDKQLLSDITDFIYIKLER